MKDLVDLKDALRIASEKKLIETFCVYLFYLDIYFHIAGRTRCEEETKKILKLRDYIKDNYKQIQSIDYMPITNRLRLYGNFESIK